MRKRSLLFGIVMFSFLTRLLAADTVAVGDRVEGPTVTTHAGESLDLSTVFEDNLVLVYFYPKADTPGCTKQACNLRDDFAALEDAGITVIGASRDDVEAQAAFKKKYNLPFTLVADTDDKLLKAFGVPKMMGLFASRQSFLLKDGVVVWRDLEANPSTQAADALAAAKESGSAGSAS